MNFDTRFAVYGVMVQERDGEPHILLALWNEDDRPKWTMPGGGADFGESPEPTLVREIAEETGYQARPGRLFGVRTIHIPAERRFTGTCPMMGVRVIYEAIITGGELRNEVDGSADEARWIPISQVPELNRVELVDEAIEMWHSTGPAN